MANAATNFSARRKQIFCHHSSGVFLFCALTGERMELACDPELLYIGAMFHDMRVMDGTLATRNASRSTAQTLRKTFRRSGGSSL